MYSPGGFSVGIEDKQKGRSSARRTTNRSVRKGR
tara:strand:+ start:88 stop:189 length:102 start_codon:yes stop_codon:yes gene_type:complete